MQSRRHVPCVRFAVAFAIGLYAQACAERPSPAASSMPTLVTVPTIAVEKPSSALAAQREVRLPPPTSIPPPPDMVWTTSTSPDGAWRVRYGSMEDLDAPSPDDSAQYGGRPWSYSSLAIESVNGLHAFQVVDRWGPYNKCALGVDFLGWSPDGTHAFAAESWPCSGGCNNPVGATHRIVRIALSVQRIDRLFEATAESVTVHGRVALSPDGRWIALREDAPDRLFAIRLLATGDEADRTAAFDFRASMFPELEAVWIEGPWSIEWLPDNAAVRFNYTTGICTQMPSMEGWVRYDLVTGTLVPDGPVSTGMP